MLQPERSAAHEQKILSYHGSLHTIEEQSPSML